MTSEAKRASLPASPFSDEPRQKRETPRLQSLATNRHSASQPMETAMTSELRPAVEVWLEAYEASYYDDFETDDKAAAVIEADREAVRAEQAAELAKYKALAETLAGALELADCALSGANMNMNVVERKVREALREYKEARDESI